MAFINTQLREFIAPITLKEIGSKAFYNCKQLSRVELNKGLCIIGKQSFANCGIKTLKLLS